jgi:hypothetical protein
MDGIAKLEIRSTQFRNAEIAWFKGEHQKTKGCTITHTHIYIYVYYIYNIWYNIYIWLFLFLIYNGFLWFPAEFPFNHWEIGSAEVSNRLGDGAAHLPASMSWRQRFYPTKKSGSNGLTQLMIRLYNSHLHAHTHNIYIYNTFYIYVYIIYIYMYT